MYFRFLAIAVLLIMTGCVQANPRYLQASYYDKAVMLYENGLLTEARQKALEVPYGDANFKAARRLVGEINSVALQLSRRHIDLADEYEKAGIYRKAVDEYNLALALNPSNTMVKDRIEMLQEAVREGRKFDIERADPKPKKQEKEKEDPEVMANTHYMKGKMYLESNSYARAIDEFNAVLKYVPTYMNTRELLAKCVKERDRAVDAHLKKGIGFFQAEDMEKAISEWDTVLELDPNNKDALDYRYRAEVILERLRKIKEKGSLERPL